jgi:sugar lactone lactonase YvrE
MCTMSSKLLIIPKRRGLHISLLIFLCLLVQESFFPHTLLASSPWKWQQSLRSEGETPFSQPAGLYVDQERQRYYVLDSGNNRMVSFDQEGKQLNSFSAAGQLSNPVAMLPYKQGKLLVVERGKPSLTVIDFKKKKVDYLSLTVEGKIIYPNNFTSDGRNYYIQDLMSGDIFVFDEELKFINQIVQVDGLKTIFTSDINFQNGFLWVLQQSHKRIVKYDPEGKVRNYIALGDSVEFPVSVALDSSGLIHVLDSHAGKVAVFDQTGNLKYIFLAPGNVRGQLYYPNKIRFDFRNRLCVVDSGNGRIEIFGR